MSARREAVATVIVTAALGVASAAAACGICIDDKVAATYDHAVVTRAAAERKVVVFTEIAGAGPSAPLVAEARRAAARVRGIDRATLRSAESPATISFALDPRAQSAESAIAAIQRGASIRGLRVTVLRVVR